MVGHDDVETVARLGHLGGGRDPAVDGEDEPAALVRESGQRLAANAVALVEAAREMPGDVRAELGQEEDGEGRGGDAVHVVVAEDADPPPIFHRGTDPVAGGLPCRQAEMGRAAGARRRGRARVSSGVGVAAPDEHCGRQLRDSERANQLGLVVGRTIARVPRCLRALQAKLRGRADGNGPRDLAESGSPRRDCRGFVTES